MPRANGITRQEILTCLKVQGSMTAEGLARELGISQVAVRQHLTSLEAEKSIDIQIERKGLGRPAHRYRLTSHGDETFPRRYDVLANSLLDELRAWQGDLAVVELVQRQRERIIRDWQPRLSGKPLPEKIKELTRLLSDCGFMAEACQDATGSFYLTKRNCIHCAVARNHPDTCCDTSAAFYERLLEDARVVRRQTILDGSQNCVFAIAECLPEMNES